MSRAQMRAYARVKAAVDKRAALMRMHAAATMELSDAIARAAATGIPQRSLAEATGYSDGRIWQLINDWQPKRGKRNVREQH